MNMIDVSYRSALGFIILLIMSIFFGDNLKAQSTPSEAGFICQNRNNLGFFAISDSLISAGSSVCGTGWEYRGGTTCFHIESGSEGGSIECSAIAVCRTGGGFEQADTGGFCPDPPSEDDGDDDDGDGNICDAGEEKGADCNQPDSDVDGDGIPDSEDDDDGKCSSFNDGDLDCDGQCGPIDDPASTDCTDEEEEGDCPLNELNFFEFSDSDLAATFGVPPDKVCWESCEYDRQVREGQNASQRGCRDSTDGTKLGCYFYTNTEECTACTAPDCNEDQTCPVGQSIDSNTNKCADIDNFCEIDDDDDGVPDNEDTFACEEEEEEECNPENFECEDDAIIQCGAGPPSCDGDLIKCAERISLFNLACASTSDTTLECVEDFQCVGDVLLCESLRLQNLSYCSTYLTEEELSNEDSLAVFREGVDDGAEFRGGDEVDGSIIDLGGLMDDLDRSGFGFGSQCFQDAEFTWNNRTYTLEYSKLCPFLDVIRWLLLLLTSYACFRIIAGAF